MAEKITTQTALLTLTLKELRLERNLGQGWLSDKIHRTASAIAKIELGKSNLTLGLAFEICQALNTNMSSVIQSVERHAVILAANGWKILEKFPNEESEQEFFKLMDVYYTKPRALGIQQVSISNSHTFDNPSQVAPMIQYLLSID